jgi:hypothetical protein
MECTGQIKMDENYSYIPTVKSLTDEEEVEGQ